MKLILNLKRQVISNLKQMIAPHVWPCGYGHNDEQGNWVASKIFSFAPVHGNSDRSMGKVFNADLTCLQGFHENGTIDASGGGCMFYSFESYCLEDLLAIEQWLSKNLAKEIPLAKQANEDHHLHNEWVSAKDGWRNGTDFNKWKKQKKLLTKPPA